jgi:hypothetical protein
MLSKYSVGVIVKGQLDTMRPYGKQNYDSREIFLIFLFPLISPLVQYFLNLRLTEGTVSIIVSATSIFAGLLLNLLVLLYSIISTNIAKMKNGGVKDLTERALIEHLFCNISYAILICVVMVMASLLTLTKQGWWVRFAELIVYYLGLQLFLLIGKILKRFHRLLEQKISIKIIKNEAAGNDIWKGSENSLGDAAKK